MTENTGSFWDHVEMVPFSSCWFWTGIINPRGYGQVSVKRDKWTTQVAHRRAFAIVHGREPVNELHHICKTPRCVNPDHLMEVTRLEHAQEWTREQPRCGHAYGKRGKYARYCSVCQNASGRRIYHQRKHDVDRQQRFLKQHATNQANRRRRLIAQRVCIQCQQPLAPHSARLCPTHLEAQRLAVIRSRIKAIGKKESQ